MAIKYYNGIAYDDQKDYSVILNSETATEEDKRQAEIARNAKIDGQGLSYGKTYNYTTNTAASSSPSNPSQSNSNDSIVTYGGVTFDEHIDYSKRINKKQEEMDKITDKESPEYKKLAEEKAELVNLRQAKLRYQGMAESSPYAEGYNYGLDSDEVLQAYYKITNKNVLLSYYVTKITYDFSKEKYSITITVNRNNSDKTTFAPFSVQSPVNIKSFGKLAI